jgi:pimeloyl-ACP methyl ester carboxylesterase
VSTARVNGINVYFERAGEGRRLLFLNASGATLASAALLVKPFTDAADTLAADQRGIGRTEIPPGPYTMADYAADALALADHVGWDHFAMVGVSFGGMVAQEVAVTAPERIERLALLCTSPGGPDAASYPLETLQDLPPDERVATGMAVLDHRFSPDWLAEHPVDQLIVDTFIRRDAADHTPEETRGLAEQLAARRGHDVVDRLDRITCPTFVGNGRYDGIAPVSNGELIATKVAHATLHVYDGGHLFVFQDSAAFPDVLRFLTA